MWRRVVLYWVIGGLSLWTLSCYDVDRSNPLDGQTAQLFVPQILQPKGGEQWFVGTTHEILWKPATHAPDSVITIQLVCDEEPGQTRVIAENTPNTGRFTWVVPDLPSPACRIRLMTRTGQAESLSPFRISPQPVLQRVPIGGEGREPAALNELVVFTSNRSGNEDLWMINRLTGVLTQLTNDPGFDGQADWLKPKGDVFAFTSDRGGRKDIWVIDRNQTPPHPIRVTTVGGQYPAWQPSFEEFPSFAFTTADSSFFGFSRILAVTLAVQPAQTSPLPDPIPVSPPLPLTSNRFNPASRFNINHPSWGLSGGVNVILYETPHPFLSTSQFWKLEFTALSLDAISSSEFIALTGRSVARPALSLSGTHVVFSTLGDLWIRSLNGGPAIQVTYDEAEDDFPDWASEGTIVFQRRPTAVRPWEIWTVRVPPE